MFTDGIKLYKDILQLWSNISDCRNTLYLLKLMPQPIRFKYFTNLQNAECTVYLTVFLVLASLSLLQQHVARCTMQLQQISTCQSQLCSLHSEAIHPILGSLH